LLIFAGRTQEKYGEKIMVPLNNGKKIKETDLLDVTSWLGKLVERDIVAFFELVAHCNYPEKKRISQRNWQILNELNLAKDGVVYNDIREVIISATMSGKIDSPVAA
jgi:hypothetical protein